MVRFKLGMVPMPVIFSSWEVEAERSGVQGKGQTGLHETQSQKLKENKREKSYEM